MRPNLDLSVSSYSVERNSSKTNGTLYEASLFSSSLSEMFSKKLGLSANDVLSDKSVDTTASPCKEVELFGSIEEIEVQTIDNLLPDENDLFCGLMEELEYITHASGVDNAEDLDLFSSVGGMELEGDNCSHVCQQDSSSREWNSHCRGSSNGVLATEHPLGEHPSRTLFVRNINSDVDDSDLQALFEQYGDIRTLYTACKHRGFVMISYYDIRAATNALRALQNKPLKHRELDIHFSIPKDNPSEKDINQDTLVAFNLDPSVSNAELRQIFSIYGEIKEIRETPNEHRYKFIEFYDVRAAEAALQSSNGCDIAGKCIKLQPSCSVGTKQCLMMKKCSELEHDKPGLCQSPNDSSLSEIMAMISPGEMSQSFMNNRSIRGKPSAGKVRISLPSPMCVASAGNHVGLCEPSQSLDQRKFGNHRIPSCHPHSFPDYHNSYRNATPYTSSNVVEAASGIGTRVEDKMRSRHICVVGSSGLSMELNGGVFGFSGNGARSLHGRHYMQSNFNSLQNNPSSSVILSNSPLNINGLHAHHHTELPRFSGMPPHMISTVSPAHHCLGSAPTLNPCLWNGWHAYTGESLEHSGFLLSPLGNMGFSTGLPFQPLERASCNGFSHAGENCTEMSTNDMWCSPHKNSDFFSPRNAVNSLPTSFGSSNDCVRNLLHRGNGGSSNHTDGKLFALEIDRILHGEDSRTTLMIKNIPNKTNATWVMPSST